MKKKLPIRTQAANQTAIVASSRTRAGFTLLEILIATGMFMIIMVIAIAVFVTTSSGSSTSDQLRINAQTTRFSFESIARELRVSRGLLYFDTTDERQKVLLPPFRVVAAGQAPEIAIYKVERTTTSTTGEISYTLSRKRYVYDPTNDSINVISEGAKPHMRNSVSVTDWTVQEVEASVAAEPGSPSPESSTRFWQATATAINLLPTGFVAEKFEIPNDHYYDYPAYGKSLKGSGTAQDLGLTQQPYIQLEMTVKNQRLNASKHESENAKTTLRTMLVPRDFVSPFDVVQRGNQGTTDQQ